MIYTFYSYKGGVGRSMALANIAELMYRAGMRVVMVDWDLEAPGLERFLSPEKMEEALDTPGIVDMLIAYQNRASRLKPGGDPPFFAGEIKNYLVDIHDDEHLWLLPAGYRAKGRFFEYADRVKTFDWQDFYQNFEGEVYFEWLREQLEQFADAVLIDSRTGVTEMGGVCTYQLADVVVLFCAANDQNINGTLEMVESFSDPRLPELRHGRKLSTLVVPSRIERLSEIPKLNEFRPKFSAIFAPRLPAGLNRGPNSLIDLEIPYVPAYAFGEIMAVQQTRTKLRSIELEEAYTNLLKVIRDLSPEDSVIRQRLQDMSFTTEAGFISTGGLPFVENKALATPSVNLVNAKVVLLGESGVGKSGLGARLAENQFRLTESTHGMQFWQIQLPQTVIDQVSDLPNLWAELTIWDLAGQSDCHIINQLFLNDTDAALLVFDGSDPTDPFRGISYWAKVLKKYAPAHALKFLVVARADRGPITVDEREINSTLAQYELDGYVRTSAKTGEGINTLLQQILGGIRWKRLPRATTLHLFQTTREFLRERKETGDTLISMGEIRHMIRNRYEGREETETEIDVDIRLLQAQGLVFRLEPTPRLTLALLKPEVINQYSSSIIRAARNHPRGIGAVAERDALSANLPFTDFERLNPSEESIVLESIIELLIQHDLCFREMGLLVFPSQINVTQMAPTESHAPTEVTYEFSGSIETIYASLVVRLSYTDYFQREDQWKYAVEFSRNGHRLGFAMHQMEENVGELEIYFQPGVGEFDRVTFIRFITDHLRTKGIDIEERIRVYCPQCGKAVEDWDAIEMRTAAGKLEIPCQYCGTSVVIPRSIEERYRSDQFHLEGQRELAIIDAEKHVAGQVKAPRLGHKEHGRDEDRLVHILHISDLRLGTSIQAHRNRIQLETDLIKELGISRLEYLVISGNIANHSIESEYDAAFELIDRLVNRFGLDTGRVVVVPGNHDVNWDLSEQAYLFVPKRKLPDPPPEGLCIPAGDAGALIRDEGLYQRRFAYFSTHFYKKLYGGQEYPLNYDEQGILHLRPNDQILFLGLNSAWEIDHHYRERAGINMDALTRALDQLENSNYDDWLKIAVWHHPITGREMMNDEFLQLLAVHGFQVCMHGHIYYEAKESFYKYDPKRGIHIIGAGIFGVSLREQTDIPMQYNLLTLDPETRAITVETRKKEKPDGTWYADARWGTGSNPKPRYTIQLK